MNRRIDPESGQIYDVTDGVPEGVDEANLVQRADDQEDAVRARLDVFAKERDAVCGVFNDIVHTVDGNQCVAIHNGLPLLPRTTSSFVPLPLTLFVPLAFAQGSRGSVH